MVKVETIQKSSARTKFTTLVLAGILATVAFDLAMYTDLAITGLSPSIPTLFGSLVLGDSTFATPVGYAIHYGNGIGLALLFGFIALPIANKIRKVPIIVSAMAFSLIENVIAVWFGMLPALGLGIAGLDATPDLAVVTFTRHVAYGAVLGLYLSRKGNVE